MIRYICIKTKFWRSSSISAFLTPQTNAFYTSNQNSPSSSIKINIQYMTTFPFVSDRTLTGMTKKTRELAEVIVAPDDDKNQNDAYSISHRRRIALSKAITLIESSSPQHIRQADLLLNYVIGHQQQAIKLGDNLTKQITSSIDDMSTDEDKMKAIKNSFDYNGKTLGSPPFSFRIGIAGPPGSGKSSFIEAFGKFVLDELPKNILKEEKRGKDDTTDHNQDESQIKFCPSKVAVVCIDPSSTLTGGSILGDKTRMMELSRHDRAYVRPSPSRGTLGGVSAYTNDVVTLCQAAGYDLILVESVGLGQSEIEISHGVDMLILMVAPGGGDGLQGVKKGIIEVADMLVVNKADGNLLSAARSTAADYKGAIHFWRSRVVDGWELPPVLLASALTGDGIGDVWNEICKFRCLMLKSGLLSSKRRQQSRYWMWKHLQDLISAKTKSNPALKEKGNKLNEALADGLISPRFAAKELLESLNIDSGSSDDNFSAKNNF